MIESSEVIDGEKLEVLAVNGDVIVLRNELGTLSDAVQGALNGTEGLQILTLDADETEKWNLNATEALTMKPVLQKMAFVPPAIEEENSLDNLPAIGHLEEFSIPTAEDGTLLPTTVNAKMADGSHQRLTLFPQILDGNVTYMVQFENEVVPSEEAAITIPEDTEALSQKIDSIISQNDDIIASSKELPPPKREQNNGLSKAARFRQRSLIKNKKLSLLNFNVPPTNALHYPNEQALSQGPSLPYLKVKEKLLNIPSSKDDSEIPSELQHAKTFLRLQKYLEAQKLELKIQPIESEEVSLKTDSSTLEQPLLNSPKIKPSCRNPVPSPPPTKNSSDGEKIFIKSSPEFFSNKEKNVHPLGSTENPIQLLQTGKTFHSKQPLSETQLRHISSILRKQKSNSSVMPRSIYDPTTNTRIVYRVVFPKDVDVDKDLDDIDFSKLKKPVKRTRQKGKTAEDEPCNRDLLKKSKMEDNLISDEYLESAKLTKLAKPARTRSGRLSRPPRYMVRDYKRIQNTADVPARAKEEDWYMDYRTPDTESTTETTLLLFDEERPPRSKLGTRNFKPEYRCPSCHKIYLGYTKMMLHLRKFPDHSNADEYEEIYQRARCERKARRTNIVRLKQLLAGVDRLTLQSTYGPFLADAFTLWDFLLLRVHFLKKTGVEEIEGLLKELSLLLEKLGKIAEELLSPVYSRDEESDVHYVDLDKHQVAYALGLSPGIYKVNTERLHLLRPAEEKQAPPTPPPPRPAQLTSKFEPNLSTKILECSNGSIDLDCNSKDVEPEEEKKDMEDTNSEFLCEFLQSLPEGGSSNSLPQSTEDGLNLWKPQEVAHVTPPPIWKGNSSPHQLPPTANEELSLWKGGKTVDANVDLQLWKVNGENGWKDRNEHCSNNAENLWKERDSGGKSQLSAWKTGDRGSGNLWEGSGGEGAHSPEGNNCMTPKDEQWKDKKPSSNNSSALIENRASSEPGMWVKENTSGKGEDWEQEQGQKDGKKDWMRLWKEESGAPGLRTNRLTSTPESHGPTLFSPPLRRNSVSSFAPTHQEELLSLDLHELFEDLMPEQDKPRRPKPDSIESIINEALFTGNAPPTTIPPNLNIISDSLDEVSNLDFLNPD